jgi:hypothetical protein
VPLSQPVPALQGYCSLRLCVPFVCVAIHIVLHGGPALVQRLDARFNRSIVLEGTAFDLRPKFLSNSIHLRLRRYAFGHRLQCVKHNVTCHGVT